MSDQMQQLEYPDGTVVVYPENDLHNLDTTILRGELARLLTITADHLLYLAAVWRELELRGEDLSDLRTGLAAYLPLIASRQMDADAVIRFAGNKTLLRAVATLPITEQSRLAAGGAIEVMTMDESGVWVSRTTKAQTLSAAQARIVFDAGKVRNLDEQRSIIESAQMKRAKRGISQSATSKKMVIDRQKKEIIVGKVRLTLSEIMGVVAELNSEHVGPVGDKKAGVMINITEEEHRQLRQAAQAANTSMGRIVRGVLVSAGLLEHADSSDIDSRVGRRSKKTLTEAEIITMRKSGSTYEEIASSAGVTKQRIQQICKDTPGKDKEPI